MNRGRQVGFGASGLRDRRRCSLLDEPLAQFSQRKIMVREVPISMCTFIVSAVYKNRHRDASDPRWFKRTVSLGCLSHSCPSCRLRRLRKNLCKLKPPRLTVL
ncbi:hypothetical protein B0T13DRAFT_103399 [Neurospora crassa]|nr:hypothetical protein B0T13DRAFT_103399 [Neurospora crassa]